jgi:asparagine synthase (glutamine-hydrolysing)
MGYTHRSGIFVSHRIRQVVDCLTHRGPDEDGVYETGSVSLGAVRLKIIDLDAGSQPMCSASRDTILLFNGEVYNHAELRAELQTLGHQFHSHSDTEVVLHAFQQWDTGCFARLRGMFSLAFWVESKRRLVLARDRMGIKPLYFHRRGDDIYFGSELKTLFAHPEIERQIDAEALEYYLSLNYVPCPFTLVEGIEKLPAGHFLEWNNGQVCSMPYWRSQIQPVEIHSLGDAQEQLDHLLKESVREHLLSDVPLGVWLSGGVDSSTILHYASQAASGPLKTFSVSFRGRSFDESRYIREVASRYGTQHHEIDLNPTLDLSSTIEEMVQFLDEPLADAGTVPVWYLSKLTRQHATVALSGEGADELFGGYITYRADHLARYARRMPKKVLRGLLSASRRLPVSNEKISFEYKLKRFLEGTLLNADIAHSHWNGAFTAAQQRELLTDKNGTCVSHLYDETMPNEDGLSRYLAFDQRYYLADDILQKVDRMSMAHSIEVRPPFLDHRIVEFAAALPERLKIRGRHHKFLLKTLMADKLPGSVLRRAKTGLDLPTHDWLRGTLRGLLMDTLAPNFVRETGIFRAEYVESLIRRHMDCEANVGYHLWGLLILFLWIKKWNIQTTRLVGAHPCHSEKALAQVG